MVITIYKLRILIILYIYIYVCVYTYVYTCIRKKTKKKHLIQIFPMNIHTNLFCERRILTKEDLMI